jgi:hypothetical protein
VTTGAADKPAKLSLGAGASKFGKAGTENKLAGSKPTSEGP